MSEGRDYDIKIVIQDLGRDLANGKGEYCLDLETGNLLGWEEVAGRDDAGEGRPAVQAGKRYIRIPPFDELYQSEKDLYDRIEVPGTRRWARNHLPDSERDDFLEWDDYMQGEQVAGNLALNWISSLRPPISVLMVDELDGETEWCLYDPATGKWEDLVGDVDDL